MKEKFSYKKYLELKDNYEMKVSRLANVRMFLFIVMVISFILKYYYYPLFFQIIFVLSLILFIIMVYIHDKYYKIYDYYVKVVDVIDSYLARESGEWKIFFDKGEDFFDDNKTFLKDLDILGDCSLFQYLSICKTLGGRERLVMALSNLEVDENTLRERQKMIEELGENIKFLVDFQVDMKYYDQKKIYLSKDFSYLDKELVNRKFDLFIGIFFGFISAILFCLSICNIISVSWFYGIFFFNLLLSYLYSVIFREEFRCLERVITSYGKLYNVFDKISREKFHSSGLKKIQNRIIKGKDKCDILNKIDWLNSLRNNLLANIVFNGFFCLNLFLLYQFSKFLNQSMSLLKECVLDIEELEAIGSLATIGIVKSNCCMPILNKDVSICFENIKHPLLEEEKCVGNDFTSSFGVNIITGSNMGGKTSFLRMVGINLILMNAGSMVCAKSFKSSYFKVFTSMRILDNIERGISTFYGELLRIQEMVSYVDKGNMLVLIDEIFKGTNYQDRIYGAKEVIKKLNTKKTIVFLTTHDFELCEEKRVHNYHVKEDYEGDKIVFDYKIRSGKAVSTNAKYLMKRLGIID